MNKNFLSMNLLKLKKSILMKKQTFLINKLTIDFINTTQTTIEKKIITYDVQSKIN